MKVPLKVERQSENMDLFEGQEKIITYKITNNNRFLAKDIIISARTVKENGEETEGKYVTSIKGTKERLLPKDFCEVKITVKLNKEYKEIIIIDNIEELAAIELEINVTATLVIAKSIA